MLKLHNYFVQSTSFASAELQARRCLPGYVLSKPSLLQRSYRACECDTSNIHILECKGGDILVSVSVFPFAQMLSVLQPD